MSQQQQSNTEQSQPVHLVVADDLIIYEGEEWASAFKEAALKPEYGEIVHVCDGEPGARWSAPLSRGALRGRARISCDDCPGWKAQGCCMR